MALFFTPMANLVLSSVKREREGQASGANNAIRELGGVFGVAVLASVFARYGGYDSGQTFVDGAKPALWIGAVVVGLGAVAAFAIPSVRREHAGELEMLIHGRLAALGTGDALGLCVEGSETCFVRKGATTLHACPGAARWSGSHQAYPCETVKIVALLGHRARRRRPRL